MDCCQSSSTQRNEEHESLCFKKRLADLEDTVKFQGTIIKELRYDLGQKKKRVKKQREGLKKLIVSVAEKGQNLEEVTMAKTKLQEILIDRDEKIKHLNISIVEKCQQLTDMAVRISELEAGTNANEETLKELNARLAEKLQQIKKEMTAENAELQLIVKKTADELVRVRNIIRESEEDAQVKSQEIQALNECIFVRNAQITTLTDETDTLKKLVQESTSGEVELQGRLMETDKQLQGLNLTTAVKDQLMRETAEEHNKLQVNLKDKNEMIVNLNKIVSEKEKEMTELKDSMDKHVQQAQVQLQDLKNALREKDDELVHLKNTICESEEKVQVKSREVQELNDCISERDAQIKTLTKEIDRYKESTHRLEHELLVNKQLQNAAKLHELEKSSNKSVEIADLISRIKEDMTGIARHLADRIDHLPVEQAAAAAAAAAVPAAAAASSATEISVPSRMISAALMLTEFSCVR